jgi:hypothetical protein
MVLPAKFGTLIYEAFIELEVMEEQSGIDQT